jgi:Domain of unknown function (DUF4328)
VFKLVIGVKAELCSALIPFCLIIINGIFLMEKIYENEGYVKFLKILFYIFLSSYVISIIISIREISLLSSVPIELTALEKNDQITQISGILSLSLFLISGLTFIFWIKRLYGNVQIVTKQKNEYTLNTALWSWFVPILNLSRPINIIKEIWGKYHVYVGQAEKSHDFSFLRIWWVLSIVSGVIARIAMNMRNSADSAEKFITSDYVSIIGDIISIPIIVLLIILINKLHSLDTAATSRQPNMPEPIN